jgi:hypothetical protein
MGVVMTMATQVKEGLVSQLLPNGHASFSYYKSFWVSSPTI